MLFNWNSATRVPMHTSESANKRIHQQMNRRIEGFVDGDPTRIHQRLQELQREVDMDRAVELLTAAGSLGAWLLGTTVHRRFLGVGPALAASLLAHAVNGWSPWVPALRALGFRTRTEIDHERYALKVLRGDFHTLPDHAEAVRQPAAAQILHMVRC